jgi:hypothetical protein
MNAPGSLADLSRSEGEFARAVGSGVEPECVEGIIDNPQFHGGIRQKGHAHDREASIALRRDPDRGQRVLTRGRCVAAAVGPVHGDIECLVHPLVLECPVTHGAPLGKSKCNPSQNLGAPCQSLLAGRIAEFADRLMTTFFRRKRLTVHAASSSAIRWVRLRPRTASRPDRKRGLFPLMLL